jgi:MscS family membrane protein
VSIGVDQPLREGDFVRVAGFLGTVEAIGLRSTRIRTLDRTLVTIPNGQLADQHVESFAARDRILLSCTLGLVYETSAAQMRAILERLERLLRAHPKVWPDVVVVRFQGFGASSLDVGLMAWFQTSDWNEFRDIRQEIFLDVMAVIDAEGSAFAFPTQTIHVAAPSPAGP